MPQPDGEAPSYAKSRMVFAISQNEWLQHQLEVASRWFHERKWLWMCVDVAAVVADIGASVAVAAAAAG